MTKIQTIIDLVNTHQKTTISLKDFDTLSFYPTEGKTHFEQFLITDRVNALLRLLVLYRFGLNASFVFGNESYGFSRTIEGAEEDTTETTEEGPCITTRTQTGESLFGYLIGLLGISQLVVQSWYIAYNQEHYNTKEKILPLPSNEGWSEYLKDDVFVMVAPQPELIITQDTVYVHKDATWRIDLEKVIKEYSVVLKEFLDTYKDKATISHDHYIPWILSWFHGLVSVRSLEYVSEDSA